jgi:hypothetical protein
VLLLHRFIKSFLMASFSLLYALLLPLSTCPDKISQQSHSYTLFLFQGNYELSKINRVTKR